ncbi:hypothetical protein HY994_02055 [Candidatus Micrarchaeota archaeon]|nr:hypothetical protein [Candidatus Micrarchaeota archaeon]
MQLCFHCCLLDLISIKSSHPAGYNRKLMFSLVFAVGLDGAKMTTAR